MRFTFHQGMLGNISKVSKEEVSVSRTQSMSVTRKRKIEVGPSREVLSLIERDKWGHDDREGQASRGWGQLGRDRNLLFSRREMEIFSPENQLW
jgi:hypothetical protein